MDSVEARGRDERMEGVKRKRSRRIRLLIGRVTDCCATEWMNNKVMMTRFHSKSALMRWRLDKSLFFFSFLFPFFTIRVPFLFLVAGVCFPSFQEKEKERAGSNVSRDD